MNVFTMQYLVSISTTTETAEFRALNDAMAKKLGRVIDAGLQGGVVTIKNLETGAVIYSSDE